MHIEIITTPNEELKESGFGTLKACDSVFSAIQRMGYRVRLSVCNTKNELDEVVQRNPAFVILAVKYVPLENENDIWLSDYFFKHGINITGSSREALKFDSSKVLAKTHLINKGIRTARYFVSIPGQYKNESELPIAFPLFLKPIDAANGNGIDDLSFVTNFSEYQSKIVSLYDTFNKPVLAEEYLDGREFTVAIIKTHGKRFIVSAVEIVPPTSKNGLRILGAQAKSDDSETITAISDSELKKRVVSMATSAFEALGARDFGRIDIKANRGGECFFMEANLVPGMTYGSSYFPQACKIARGLTYDKVVELILGGVLDRTSSTIPPISRLGSGRKLVAATQNAERSSMLMEI